MGLRSLRVMQKQDLVFFHIAHQNDRNVFPGWCKYVQMIFSILILSPYFPASQLVYLFDSFLGVPQKSSKNHSRNAEISGFPQLVPRRKSRSWHRQCPRWCWQGPADHPCKPSIGSSRRRFLRSNNTIFLGGDTVQIKIIQSFFVFNYKTM